MIDNGRVSGNSVAFYEPSKSLVQSEITICDCAVASTVSIEDRIGKEVQLAPPHIDARHENIRLYPWGTEGANTYCGPPHQGRSSGVTLPIRGRRFRFNSPDAMAF